MTPDQFKSWRLDLGWTQGVAADRLGMSISQVGDYESGSTRHLKPRPVVVPRVVELACAALRLGVNGSPHGFNPLNVSQQERLSLEYSDAVDEIEELRKQLGALKETGQTVVDAYGRYEWKDDPELPEGWWSPMARSIDTEEINALAVVLKTTPNP